MVQIIVSNTIHRQPTKNQTTNKSTFLGITTRPLDKIQYFKKEMLILFRVKMNHIFPVFYNLQVNLILPVISNQGVMTPAMVMVSGNLMVLATVSHQLAKF